MENNSSEVGKQLFTLDQPAHDQTFLILCGLLLTGVCSNSFILWRNLRGGKKFSSYKKSAIYISNVAAANLLISMCAIPVEIGWRLTIEWQAGDAGCRVLQFLRVIGLYALSSNLTAIAIDKVLEIRQLLRTGTSTSSPWVFPIAWLFSVILALPQVFVFQARFSELAEVVQCEAKALFSTRVEEDLYDLYMMAFMFILPAVLIISSYVYIILILRKSKSTAADESETNPFTSSMGHLESISLEYGSRPRVFSAGQKSEGSSSYSHTTGSQTSTTEFVHNDYLNRHTRLRSQVNGFVMLDYHFEQDVRIFATLSLTFLITTFPFVIFTTWYLADSHSHGQIHPIMQEIPFLLVLANTVFIPAVYGLKNFQRL